MVERVQPVIAADGHKACRRKTPVEYFRDRLADPVQIRLVACGCRRGAPAAVVPA